MISQPCKFPGCKSHPQTNGYCIGHRIYAGASTEAKKPYRIPAKSAKKIAAEKQAAEVRGDAKTELQLWYDRIMSTEEPVCWETGESIDKTDRLGWHGSIAHILPKKTFPSVATHPLNYVILKMWGGTHDRYDGSWSKAQKMKVWPRVVERFLQFQHEIADSERKYIPDCLLKHIPEKEQI